jgi:hypothetical protein
MELEQVYYVGELVAAIAVIASLIFVGIQMRHSRLASQAQGTINTSEIYSRWRMAIMESSDLANIVDKANSENELSGAERIKLAAMADELFISASVAYASGGQTGLVHDRQGEIDYITIILDQNPGLIRAWQLSKQVTNSVSTQFVDIIDDHLTRAA